MDSNHIWRSRTQEAESLIFNSLPLSRFHHQFLEREVNRQFALKRLPSSSLLVKRYGSEALDTDSHFD